MRRIKRTNPVDIIAQSAAENVAAWIYQNHEERPIGDTAIEKVFSTALIAYCEYVINEFTILRIKRGERFVPCDRDVGGTDWMKANVHMETQVEYCGFRVDFAFHVMDTKDQWQTIIVECDGHDFHERTKEQAAKDRSRDRALQLKGYKVLRFTGSELWRKPMECAEQVADAFSSVAFN